MSGHEGGHDEVSAEGAVEEGRRSPWRRRLTKVAILMAVWLVAGAAVLAFFVSKNEPPKTPRLSVSVPPTPVYTSVSDIADRLAQSDVGCENRVTHPGGGVLSCTSMLREIRYGSRCDVRMQDFSGDDEPARGRDEFIDTAFRRAKVLLWPVAAVAGPTWAVTTCPDVAPRVVEVLGGVEVHGGLPPLPDAQVPLIPDGPAAASVDNVADRLDRVVGCTSREYASQGESSLKCVTDRVPKPSCATVAVYPSAAERDAAIRSAFAAGPDRPALVVTARNWIIGLCDASIADEVASGTGGRVIAPPG